MRDAAATAGDGEAMPRIAIKRVYDPVDRNDGVRVLVDRLWPRGISKEALKADHWLREAAPSDELRRWFNHDPERWEAFRQRYVDELRAKPEVVDFLLELARGERGVVLLFSARDPHCNQAVALQRYLSSLVGDGDGASRAGDR